MPAIIERNSTPSTTTYFIAGVPADVQFEIDRIFGDYNPWGYGTLISSDETTETGRVAVIKRSNSCD